MYEETINQMLTTIANDDRFGEPIRHLCSEALNNNWTLEKKVNVINIVTK